ncbi:transposase [Schlesneria paludicola]|uniref:transposase n=1 Tax=Schlesneria paludicola TaxID=360056 RepID=UPI0012FB06A6
MEHVKRKTSNWAKREPHHVVQFSWQSGYRAFSVSESMLEDVILYIEQQEQRHARSSIQDEFRELCRRHHIEIDEQDVWD